MRLNATIHAALICAVLLPGARAELPALDCIIEPSQLVSVSSPVRGVIETLYVDQGDLVEPKQPIARLESAVQAAAVRQARARALMRGELEAARAALDFGRRNLQRMEELSGKGVIARHELDGARTEVDVAQARLKQARENQRLAELELERAQESLEQRTIRSSISGVVVERFAAPGEFIDEAPMLRLAQIDPLHVHALAPAEHFGRVEIGMRGQVQPETDATGEQPARVISVDRVVDAASGTFGIRLEVENPEHALPSGLKCQLTLAPATPTPAVVDADVELRESPSLASLAAAAEAETTQIAPASVAKSIETSAPTANAEQCHIAGPIEDDEVANSLVEKLRDHGVRAAATQVEGEYRSGFLVLSREQSDLETVRSHADELRANGITDVAALTRKEHAGRLSFGFYRSRERAMLRAQALTRHDLVTEIVPRYLDRSHLVVEIDIAGADINAATLDEIVTTTRSWLGLKTVACPLLAAQFE